MQSNGIESSVPISGSAAMISAKRFKGVSTRLLCQMEFIALTMLDSCAKSTSCSSMAPKMTWNACRRLLKMVTFHCFRSEAEKPLVWRRRICLSTVDLPDSPAPFVLLVRHWNVS
jgi:hypothetical protein